MIYVILAVTIFFLCILLWVLQFRFVEKIAVLTELMKTTSGRIDRLEQSYQSLAAGQYMLLLSDVKGDLEFTENSNGRDLKEEIQSLLNKTDENHQKIIETQKKIFPNDENPVLPWLKYLS